MRVINKIINKVYPINLTASFFLPSIYNMIGLPNTKNPVIAAEHTKSKSIEIITNIVSSFGMAS